MDRETEDDGSNVAAMFALDTWNKMMVIAGAAGMRMEEGMLVLMRFIFL